MKLTLLSCLTLFSIACISQNVDKEFSLAEIRSSDSLEYETFSYNANLQLQSVETLLDTGTMVRDSLFYDAAHNISQVKVYQLLGGNWTYVSYLDYTFDENGNRLSRSNYNSFDGETFILGGVYNYQYQNNRLTNWEVFMGGTDLVEIGSLTYDANGKVVKELAQDNWNAGVWQDAWKIEYAYNPNGTLTSSTQSYYDGSIWDSHGTDWFYYDDNGNCIKWEFRNGATVLNRNEYEYNLDFTVDQLVIPYKPEMDSEKKNLVAMNNMVTLRHWHTQNDQGDLEYIGDYSYSYDTLGAMGLANPGLETLRIFPNPAMESITIMSKNNSIRSLKIIDLTGKTVLTESNLNKREVILNVSTLSAGTYLVRMATSKGPVTQKILIE